MSSAPLMPVATAVWLVENTSLTFKQIADFCKMHEVEIKSIADGEVGKGIVGYNPIIAGQLTRDEINLSSKDQNRPLKLLENEIQISSHSNISTISSDKPFDYIQNLLDKYKVAEQKDLPRFYGGYVGFFSYETSRYAEKKLFSLKKNSSIYNSEMPELFLVKAEELIIYDNHDQSVKIVLNVNPQENTIEDALEAK